MSTGIDALSTEISRLETLATEALAVGDFHQYKHHKTHCSMYALLKTVLVDLDNRVITLEP